MPRFCAVRAGVWLGVGAALLGAHHRLPRPVEPPVTERTLVPVDLLAGAGPAAATAAAWSPVQSFRLVSSEAWGRATALDSTQLATILKLNRIDASHLRRRTLVVPDSIGDDLAYSPFPASLPAVAAAPKFIAVSRRVQAFAAYEHGRLIRWGPTSSGKRDTPTDTGLFFTNWKSRKAVSTDDPSWILNWYFNIIATRGVAFHEYDLPGRPASHGCIRLLEDDAHWIYQWADQWVPGRGSKVSAYGTPVLVFGDYDYGRPAPWLALASDPSVALVGQEELAEALAPNIDTITNRIRPGSADRWWLAMRDPGAARPGLLN
jgi:L,D-transpeptidase-like protein